MKLEFQLPRLLQGLHPLSYSLRGISFCFPISVYFQVRMVFVFAFFLSQIIITEDITEITLCPSDRWKFGGFIPYGFKYNVVLFNSNSPLLVSSCTMVQKILSYNVKGLNLPFKWSM